MKIIISCVFYSVYSQELILVTYALLRIKNNNAKLGLVTLNMFGVSKSEHLNPTSWICLLSDQQGIFYNVGWQVLVQSSHLPLGHGMTSRERKGGNSGGNERTQPSNCEVIACVCAVGILQNMGLKKTNLKLYQASTVWSLWQLWNSGLLAMKFIANPFKKLGHYKRFEMNETLHTLRVVRTIQPQYNRYCNSEPYLEIHKLRKFWGAFLSKMTKRTN